jgi:methionine-rich copper-binding protein CopC
MFTLSLAGRASAHARVDHADPKVGSAVSAVPTEVKIWFTDSLDMSGTTIEVLDSAGNQVDKKDIHLDPKDKSAAAVSLPTLAAGKYKVVWHARCPQGHDTKGEFTFELK